MKLNIAESCYWSRLDHKDTNRGYRDRESKRGCIHLETSIASSEGDRLTAQSHLVSQPSVLSTAE